MNTVRVTHLLCKQLWDMSNPALWLAPTNKLSAHTPRVEKMCAIDGENMFLLIMKSFFW